MSIADNIIPTFKPSQRVRLQLGPMERKCKRCGVVWEREHVLNSIVGVVVREYSSRQEVICRKCGSIDEFGPGFFLIAGDNGCSYWGSFIQLEPLEEAEQC